MIRLLSFSLILAITTGCSDNNIKKNHIITDIQAVTLSTHYPAKIISVTDGDTVRVADFNDHKHKIRLAYIDTPELNQAHGKAARQALVDLLDETTVEINVFDHDRYGREVAQIQLNGTDINLKQLENGHAWHYVAIARKKQNPSEYAAYARAESAARNQRIGLWHQQNPQAPWTFRKEARETKPPKTTLQ